MKPKYSIVMSCYNSSVFLEECIQSLLHANKINAEIIIVDDGSSDNTFEILSKYKKYISIIRNNSNIGLSLSLNKAIKHATGDYIIRMDDDDICFQNRFVEQTNFHREANYPELMWSNIDYISKDGKFICHRYQPSLDICINDLDVRNWIVHPTVIFSKSAFLHVGQYNENFKTGQDWDLWKRFKNEKYKFNFQDKVVLKYRIHSNQRSNISKSFDEKKLYLETKVKNKHKLNLISFIVDGIYLGLLIRYLLGENLIDKMRKWRLRLKLFI